MPEKDHQFTLHLPAPPVSGDTPLLPARMVNEFVYCPRLAYLMWTQSEWSETGDTVEGRRVHQRVDRPNAPLPAPEALEADEAKVVSRSLTLSSETLGVIAKIDVAEAEDGVVTPIDYKRGKRPHVAEGALLGELPSCAEMETQLRELVKAGEDHVLLIDVGPADKTELAVESIGKTFAKIERRATVI